MLGEERNCAKSKFVLFSSEFKIQERNTNGKAHYLSERILQKKLRILHAQIDVPYFNSGASYRNYILLEVAMVKFTGSCLIYCYYCSCT